MTNTSSNARLAFSINEAVEVSGISRTTIFAAIKAGKLVARKYGRRTLIAAEDLKAFLDALPKIESRSGL